MRAIFDQQQTMLVADVPDSLDSAGKIKIVHGQYGARGCRDLRLEVRTIRHAVTLNRVENRSRTVCLNRLNCRSANVGWDQNILARRDSESGKTVIDGIPRPEKLV